MNNISQRDVSEKKHFDLMAAKYDENYGYSDPFTIYKIQKKTRRLCKLVTKHFGKKKLNILEIGCGTGEYTYYLCKLFPKANILGLDISPKIIKVAKKKNSQFKNVKFTTMSAYHTSFKNESFDMVCGFYILHHLDIKMVVKEIERLLKPGGLSFFYEPNILNPMVYLVKSNTYLKKRVGDSPDEWAINPLKLKKQFSPLEIADIKVTEYIYPLTFLPYRFKVVLDNISEPFSRFPVIKYFGGSVAVCAKKEV